MSQTENSTPSLPERSTGYDPWFQTHLEVPRQTLWTRLQTAIARNPSARAITYLGQSFTYADIQARCEQTIAALSALGVGPGDVVTFCLPNIPQAVYLFYAVNQVGAILSPVHPLTPPGDLREILEHTESRFLFLLDLLWPRHQEMLSSMTDLNLVICSVGDELVSLTRLGYALTAGRKAPRIKPQRGMQRWSAFLKAGGTASEPGQPVDPDQAAVYLHSGGTTGRPKTIMLNAHSFNILAEQIPQIVPPEADGRFHPERESLVAVLPLFHGFGLAIGLHGPLTCGVRILLVPQFSPEALAKVILREKATVIAAVPTLYEGMMQNARLQKADLSCLKSVFCGGDTLPQDLRCRFDQFLQERGSTARLREGYGLTETVTVNCVSPSIQNRPGTVGLPLADMHIRIVRPGTTETVPVEEEGEICIQAPTRMLGYLKDPEATAEALVRHPDGEIWVHTGDWGSLDADGYLRFRQRLKRIIKVSGNMVFPARIEEVAHQVPGVRLACAIGAPHPYKMQVVYLFVQPEDTVTDQEALRQAILKRCEEELIRYAVPQQIIFRQKLPLTRIGKVDFNALAADLQIAGDDPDRGSVAASETRDT